MPMLKPLLALLLLLFAPLAQAAESQRNPNATVALLAETATPAPGKPLTLGVRISANPDWHSYWVNPGESGIENRLEWTLPAGATAAPARYPVPMTYVISGIMNHVYEGDATLLVDVAVPAGLAPGTPFPVTLKLSYLICSDELCVPEGATLTRNLVIGDGAADPAVAPAFAAARTALPRPLAAEATFERRGESFLLSVPVEIDADRAHFFARTDGALVYSAPQTLTKAGDRLLIETKAGADASLKTVEGVLRVDRVGQPPLGFALVAAPGTVDAGAVAARSAAGGGGGGDTGLSVPLAFLLALGGGLILNIMPCVFPILSLKALSLARAGGTETQARSEAVAYTAGVVLSVMVLGAVIIALTRAGSAIGWAFQLQDPRAVLVLLILVTGIALNLAGVFEVRLGSVGGGKLADKGGTGGAFWTGVLAAAVATPCTGPFMGAALGATLVLPPLAALSIYAGLGLGLALPFLALGFIPALRKRLPRPGPWMERFRHILAVPMFLTAVALAWVLGRQAGVPGMAVGLLAATAFGLALWWLGGAQLKGRPVAMPLAAGLAAAVLALGTVRPAPAAVEAAESAAEGPLAARPFSEAALAEARATGKPVFVYFTADWCITCKVNERGAMADASVRQAFDGAGVVTLVGDWTNGDAAITRFLAARGRAGVPLYIFYGPDGSERILPQLLTAAALTDLV